MLKDNYVAKELYQNFLEAYDVVTPNNIKNVVRVIIMNSKDTEEGIFLSEAVRSPLSISLTDYEIFRLIDMNQIMNS